VSSFKFVRKYETQDQFLKAASAHFNGTVFMPQVYVLNSVNADLKQRLNQLGYCERHAGIMFFQG